MGLFSGGFGTGFVTGLASSVDKSLNAAIESRKEEMSAARTYLRQRQAQKEDLIEAEDKRAKKALERFVRESNGNVAMGLAAYNAAGGDIESAEAFIKDMDETRRAGIDYKLTDNLKLEGVDLTKFKDLTMEKAFGSIRGELSGVDIGDVVVDDPFKGTMFEFKGGAQQKIVDEVNASIKPRQREAIAGLTGAVLDRSNTITSLKARSDLQAAIPDLEKQLAITAFQIDTGKDLLNRDIDDAGLVALQKRQAKTLARIASVAAGKDTSEGGVKLGDLSTSFTKGLNDLEKQTGYKVSPEGIITVTDEASGELLEADAAQRYWLRKKNNYYDSWVKTNLLDENGDFRTTNTERFSELLVLGASVDRVKGTIKRPAEGGGAAKAEDKAPAAGKAADVPEVVNYKKPGQIVKDPAGFASFVYSKNKNVDVTTLYQNMITAGVAPEAAAAEAERVRQQQEEAKKKAANAPQYVPGKGLVYPKQNAGVTTQPVEPRPRGRSGMSRHAAKMWDNRYGQTHNPDGTPKVK
jgi:hypothetical protein